MPGFKSQTLPEKVVLFKTTSSVTWNKLTLFQDEMERIRQRLS